jgi:hypothetical protein
MFLILMEVVDSFNSELLNTKHCSFPYTLINRLLEVATTHDSYPVSKFILTTTYPYR